MRTNSQFQLSTGRPAGSDELLSFRREEISTIFSVYGPMVARGEWRDYAIDMLKGRAVFSIFRRTSECPLFRIEKRPRDNKRQGTYFLIGMDGRIVKRGHQLPEVLAPLRRKALRAI